MASVYLLLSPLLAHGALAANPPPMTVEGKLGVDSQGSAGYSVSIVVPPGTSGMAPSLSLNYSSQGTNGVVGYGWSLGGLPAITRCPRTVAQDGVHGSVNFDATDRFCLDGQRLLVINGGTYGADGSEYRTEIESFSRVIAHTTAGVSGPGWFEVHTKSGQILELGNTTDSRILAQGKSAARVWAVDKISDTVGNYMTIVYSGDSGQYYPDHIAYTGHTAAGVSPYNSIYFVYAPRNDVSTLYHAGSSLRTTVLLSHIKTYVNATGTGTPVTDYRLTYQLGNAPASQLISLQRCDGSGNCLAPATFGWQTAATWSSRIVVDSTPPLPTFTWNAGGTPVQGYPTDYLPGDFNGDGLQDASSSPFVGGCQLSDTTPILATPGPGLTYPALTFNYNDGTTGPACIWGPGIFIPWLGQGGTPVADFNGDGLADLIPQNVFFATHAGVMFSDGAGHFVETGSTVVPAVSQQNYNFGDFDGDGRTDYWLGNPSDNTYAFYLSQGDGNFVAGASHPSPPTGTTMKIIGDADGDGCQDVLFQGADNEVRPSCPTGVSSIPVTNYYNSNNTYVTGDFNGDGNADFITIGYPNGHATTLNISTGTSFIQSTVSGVTCGGPSSCSPAYQFFTADVDGDGKTDLVYVELEDFKVYTWDPASQSLTLALTVNVELPQPGCTLYCTKPGWNGTLQVGDVDGDGCMDLVVESQAAPFDWYYKFGCHPPLLMTSISNGIGSTTTITYNRLNANQPLYTKCLDNPTTYLCGDIYPTQAVDGPIYVVQQVDSSNGLGVCAPPSPANCFTTSYAYEGEKTDLQGRGLLGFQRVTTTNSQTHVVQTTNYNTQFPLTGTIIQQTTKLRNGSTTLSSVTNSYGTIPTVPVQGTPTFVYLASTQTAGEEVDGTPLPSSTTSHLNPDLSPAYDAYGNPTYISVAVSDGSSKTTTNTFTNNATSWILGQLTYTSVTSTVPGSTITRSSGFHYTSAGVLDQEVIEPTATGCNGNGTACRLQTDYNIDVFGNRHIVTVSGAGFSAHATTYNYMANGSLQTSTINALMQTDTLDYSGSRGTSFGVPTSRTDENSHTTTFSYDNFGRQILQILPGTSGAQSATSYQYCAGVNGGTAACPANAAYMAQITPYAHDGTTRDGPITRLYYDALARVISTDVEGFDGPGTGCTLANPCWIRTATNYDVNGYVAQTSRPYYLGATPQWTINSYADDDPHGDPDPYGRVWSVTNPDLSVTSYVYKGLGNAGSQTTGTNALSQTTTTKKNAQGLVFAVTNALNKTTSYVYDAYNDLLTVTDPMQNEVNSTYDIRGHKISTADPDLGLWNYTYDALGELLTQVDPNERAAGTMTTLSYDLLGRPTSRVEPDQTNGWSYDTAAHGVGLIAGASGSNGGYGRTHFYDTLSRPTKITLAINAHNYNYNRTYDSENRIATLTYPSGLVVKYVYTQLGYLQQLQNNTTGAVLWTANARDAEMHLTDATAGNNMETISVFDPQTGLVKQIRSSHDGADDSSTANFSYSFDVLGNLTSRADTYGSSENFCYDPLNRLQYYSVGGATCQTGTNGLVKSVAYNSGGNITNKSDLAAGGNGNYAYPASGPTSALPHAVKSINGTVNGVLDPKYGYDADGNLVCEYTGGSCAGGTPYAQQAYWSFNMAKTITEGSNTLTFNYDSEHARITQQIVSGSTTSTTTYLNDPVGGTMSEKIVSGSTTSWNDYLMVDGKLIGERMTAGAAVTLNYFVLDHLGSVAVITDGTTGSPTYGQTVARESFDAWGRQRNVTGSDDPSCSLGTTSPTTRGFTGQEEMPALCLVNLNARIYDPTIARFMTADPTVPNKLDGQNYNRYTYVNNRPLTLTDPTGLGDTPLDQNPPQNSDWADPSSNPDMSCEGAGCGTTVLTGTGVDDSGQTVKIIVIINNFNGEAHLTVAGCVANCEGSTGTSGSGSTAGPAPSDQNTAANSPSANNTEASGVAFTSKFTSNAERYAAAHDQPSQDKANAGMAEQRVKDDFAANPDDEPADMRGKDWHVDYSHQPGPQNRGADNTPRWSIASDAVTGKILSITSDGITDGTIRLYLGSAHTQLDAVRMILHEIGHHSAAALKKEIEILMDAAAKMAAGGKPVDIMKMLQTDVNTPQVENLADDYVDQVYPHLRQ